MKTKKELNALKEEVEALNKKLAELTEEELVQISGGEHDGFQPPADPKREGTKFMGWTRD